MQVKQPGRWGKDMRCPHCKAVVNIEPDDVQYSSNKDYTGESDPMLYAVCGWCHSKMRLVKVPPGIAEIARKKFED